MKVFIFLVVVVAAVYAQTPCNPPLQWESQEHRFSEQYGYFIRRKLSSDEINLRERRIEEVDNFFNHSRDFFDELFLYKERVYYQLNLRTRQCEKRPLLEPFHTHGVPPNVTGAGQSYIGTAADPQAGLLTNAYKGYTERGYYFGVFTAVGCLPVYHTYFSTQGYTNSFYYDIVGGISDPNVFIPPPECLQ
eukprot:m.306069 g.306069  ORF g.306069 m.306069 type:complete len:191 (+) comp40936_c0_seq1:60-632(+)